MTQPAEQFLAATKAAVTDLNEVAVTSFAGFEKLVELNMTTAKAALAESAEQAQAILSAKAPQDLATLVQPSAEKAAAYGRAVASIVTETGTALSKAAETKFADVQAQALANIEAALKHAPTGSEVAVKAFKDAIAAGQKALETAQASTKQAVEAAEKNFAAVTEVAVKATKPAAKAK